MSDTSDMVSVPREALKLLYECAKEYDVRIPREGHNLWAAPFFDLFETDGTSRKEQP